MKLSVEQLKSLVMFMDGDAANTEEYEHSILNSEDIRYST